MDLTTLENKKKQQFKKALTSLYEVLI